MSKSLLELFSRVSLGAGLGVAIVAVPYATAPFPIDALRGGIALVIVLFCAFGMGYWGEKFFETLANLLKQSGLY